MDNDISVSVSYLTISETRENYFLTGEKVQDP